MKDRISVITSFRKFLKVLTRSRRVFVVQFDRERAHRGFNLYLFVVVVVSFMFEGREIERERDDCELSHTHTKETYRDVGGHRV